MFNLDLTSSPAEPEQPLAPARALLTPLWIASLAVLVANDHVFKGSGLLPGVVTGKLSDFAGLIVAPVLLAALLRVRSRRALLACHLAVGAVFAGIQLSPAFAAQWSALMGMFGHPWVITCDPTDLIALPALLMAWQLLVPEMDASLPALTPLRRSAVGALSLFGLWSTVATSDGGVDFDDTWYEDVNGNLYINNANEHDIALFIRPLRADVQLDCLQVTQDPGRMLRPEAFGDAEHWLLPARTNVAISLTGQCGAAWVAGEGIDPTIIFVEQVADFPNQWISGQSFDPEFLGDAGMALVFGDDGAEWTGGEQLRFVPRAEAPNQPEVCEANPDGSRLYWSTLPAAVSELVAIESGIDGCFELSLQRQVEAGGETPEPDTWYLCAPDDAVPFELGELLDIREVTPSELEITLLHPESLLPATDEQGRVLRRVSYLRGISDPVALEPFIERPLVAVPNVDCPWATEEGCANVERGTQLAVAGAQSFMELGQPIAFGGNTMLHTAIVTYARELAVLDQSCSAGAQALSYDIDVAIVDEPL